MSLAKQNKRRFIRIAAARGVLVAELLVLFAAIGCSGPNQTEKKVMTFTATAYSQKGRAKDGSKARAGTVAADPRVLPVGSVIRVSDAGEYSGTYKVVDTGAKVRGRHIDIFIPNRREAREFGRQTVEVTIVRIPSDKTGS